MSSLLVGFKNFYSTNLMDCQFDLLNSHFPHQNCYRILSVAVGRDLCYKIRQLGLLTLSSSKQFVSLLLMIKYLIWIIILININ